MCKNNDNIFRRDIADGGLIIKSAVLFGLTAVILSGCAARNWSTPARNSTIWFKTDNGYLDSGSTRKPAETAPVKGVKAPKAISPAPTQNR